MRDSVFEGNWEVKGTFQLVSLTKYLDLTCYNKKKSAEYKLKYKNMTENEREVFKEEAKEGYRAEIKLRLRRGFYEALSYSLVFDSMDHESLIDLIKIKKNDKIYGKKLYEFEFTTLTEGYFEFSDSKCVVLFNSIGNFSWGLSRQGVKGRGEAILRLPLDPLEDHGSLSSNTPPNVKHSYGVQDGGFWKIGGNKWSEDKMDVSGIGRF